VPTLGIGLLGHPRSHPFGTRARRSSAYGLRAGLLNTMFPVNAPVAHTHIHNMTTKLGWEEGGGLIYA